MRRRFAVEAAADHVRRDRVIPRADERVVRGPRRQEIQQAPGERPVPVRDHAPEDLAVLVEGELVIEEQRVGTGCGLRGRRNSDRLHHRIIVVDGRIGVKHGRALEERLGAGVLSRLNPELHDPLLRLARDDDPVVLQGRQEKTQAGIQLASSVERHRMDRGHGVVLSAGGVLCDGGNPGPDGHDGVDGNLFWTALDAGHKRENHEDQREGASHRVTSLDRRPGIPGVP